MTPTVEERIEAELARIEQTEAVTVLYACESGSRAWGFASKDSDYDVRFIYLRKTDAYLTIQDKRDVIEKPIDDELDVSGWDLPKALQLLRKSNPPLLEWLQSPIVYRKHDGFLRRIGAVMDDYYSPINCMYHYLHMAQNNYRTAMTGETVKHKKYFYVLRPVLACMWIERGMGVVPIAFATLVDRLLDRQGEHAELCRAIDDLLEVKRRGTEAARGPRITPIADFLEAELARLEEVHEEPAKTRDPATLDRLFVEMLREVNGDRIGVD